MGKINVLITFHIAPELLDKIKAVSLEIEVLYDPNLLGKPRYLNDQTGETIKRTSEQENKLQKMMAEAEILFGYIPFGYQKEIKKWFPKLKWNQSPSAGIGWSAKENGWIKTDVVFTTSSGMHDTPLAEFCIMAMLMYVKNYFLMASEKEKKTGQEPMQLRLKEKLLP